MEIRLKQVAKSFDKKQVIRPTTLTIEDGQLYDAAGAFRLRQNNASADDCRIGNAR